VAKTILNAAEYPVRDAFVGGAARTLSASRPRAAPDRFSRRQADGPRPDRKEGTHDDEQSLRGTSEAKVIGDHQGSTIRPSLYTKAARHPAIALTAAGATAAGVGLFLWSRGRSKPAAIAETSAEAEVEAHPS
jgi:hypothetical protein